MNEETATLIGLAQGGAHYTCLERVKGMEIGGNTKSGKSASLFNILDASEPQVYQCAIRGEMGALGGAEHQAERIVMTGTGYAATGHPLGFAEKLVVGWRCARIGIVPIGDPFGDVGRHVVNAVD